MKSFSFLSAFLVIYFTVLPTHAQDVASTPLPPVVPITSSNAGHITELLHYGNGTVNSPPLWSPDGKTVAILTSLGVFLYDTAYWNAAPRELDIPSIQWATFSPDGRSIATVNWPFWYGEGQTLSIWDVVTGEKKSDLTLNGPITSNIVYTPDGSLICAGDNSGWIGLWDAQTGSLRAKIRAHLASSTALLAVSPDGQWLVSSSKSWLGPGTMVNPSDQMIRLWNIPLALKKGRLDMDTVFHPMLT